MVIHYIYDTGIVILLSIVASSDRIVRGVTGSLLIRRHVCIIADTILLTGDTITETELEVIEPMHILHEGLFDLPTHSHRGEYTPTVTLMETRRTITTDSSGNHDLVPTDPVQTTEEGNEVVLTLTGRSRSISRLTGFGLITEISHRIETATVALEVIVEMLPLVTSHDVEVLVSVLPVMSVLCEAVELEVVFHFLGITIPAGIVVCGTIGAVLIGLLTERVVSTEVSMQHQVFKTVNLIGSLNITNKLSGVGFIGLMFEHSEGVSLRFEAVHPSGILVRTIRAGRSTERLEITIPVLIQLLFSHVEVFTIRGTRQNTVTIDIRKITVRIDRLSRVFIQISTCDTGLVLIIDIHSLRIDVKGEVIVQEGRVEVQRSSNTLHLRAFDSTVIEGITDRSTIRHIDILVFETTGQRDVMVGRDSGTIDFLEPIYIVIHEERILLTSLTGTSSVRTEFITGEDVQMLEHGTEGNVTIIGHFHLRTGFTFLGSNEDDTVRSTGTVDSSSGRILEDGEGLDIIRVHQGERVRYTLDTIVIHSKSIDDDQRVVGSVQR